MQFHSLRRQIHREFRKPVSLEITTNFELLLKLPIPR